MKKSAFAKRTWRGARPSTGNIVQRRAEEYCEAAPFAGAAVILAALDDGGRRPGSRRKMGTPTGASVLHAMQGSKQRLRFSKTGDAGLEAAYATHLVRPVKRPFHSPRAEPVAPTDAL